MSRFSLNIYLEVRSRVPPDCVNPFTSPLLIFWNGMEIDTTVYVGPRITFAQTNTPVIMLASHATAGPCHGA